MLRTYYSHSMRIPDYMRSKSMMDRVWMCLTLLNKNVIFYHGKHSRAMWLRTWFVEAKSGILRTTADHPDSDHHHPQLGSWEVWARAVSQMHLLYTVNNRAGKVYLTSLHKSWSRCPEEAIQRRSFDLSHRVERYRRQRGPGAAWGANLLYVGSENMCCSRDAQ